MDNIEEKSDIASGIQEIIEELRPFLNMDGGDISFVKYDEKEKTVYVKMFGACAMCVLQDDTLENGLLSAVREKYPDVKNVIKTPI